MKLFHRKPANRVDAVAPILDGYELPTFPSVINEALAILGDPTADMSAVARVLTLDPGVTASMLQMANSAALGLRNQVSDLHQAVALIGRNQVESILISTAVKSSLPSVRSPVFDSTRFWRTAAERAVVATAVCTRIQPAHRSEAFTVALLHDMALPVLIDRVDGYENLLQRWYNAEISDLAAAETDTFGWNHGAVAGLMGTMWGFPESILHALTEHHDGLDTNVMVWSRLVAPWREGEPDESRQLVIDDANGVPALKDIDCQELIDVALAEVGDVAAMFT